MLNSFKNPEENQINVQYTLYLKQLQFGRDERGITYHY